MANNKLTREDVLDLIPCEKLRDVVDDFFNKDVYQDFARLGWDNDEPYNVALMNFLADTIAREVSRTELADHGWIDGEDEDEEYV